MKFSEWLFTSKNRRTVGEAWSANHHLDAEAYANEVTAALRQQIEEAQARADKAEQRLANAEAQEVVAWGIPNSRPTERNPLMQVLLDNTSCQYPELLLPLYLHPAPPATDARATCARCKGSGIVSLGNNPHVYGSATCNVCGGSGKEVSLSFKQPVQDDKARMDWLEVQAASGHISICFELDGGVHVTLDPVGEDQRAARNVASVREGIDALAASKGGDAS